MKLVNISIPNESCTTMITVDNKNCTLSCECGKCIEAKKYKFNITSLFDVIRNNTFGSDKIKVEYMKNVNKKIEEYDFMFSISELHSKIYKWITNP